MFPKSVQIQTSSFCQGPCPYCPYADTVHDFPQGIMPRPVVDKLIKECGEHNIERLCFYLMNEPLLDPRLISILELAERYCQNTVFEISTNAIAVTPGLARDLSGIVDLVVLININNTTPIENVVTLLGQGALCKGLLYKDHMTEDKYWDFVQVFKDHDAPFEAGVVDDRAGNLPHVINLKHYDGLDGHCMNNRLDEWMHILWNGDVILCCQDWRRTSLLGNVNDNTIQSVADRLLIDRQFHPDSKPELCGYCARWVE